MHDTEIFSDVLAFLENITAERLPPDRALDRVQSLREKHSGATVDLVWDDEAFDGSFHYDALVRTASAGRTMSLSVCRDGDLPWVLRGLQRWRDSELLRVNEVTLSVEQAITELDLLWNNPGLMQRLIDGCIVEGALKRRDIQVSAADVQSALNSMRRQRGLHTVAALQAWMDSSGISRETLQEIATTLARKARLRDMIADTRMEPPLADLDEIKVAILEVDSETDAMRAAEVVRSGSTQLLEVAQELFLQASNRHAQISLREDARHVLVAEFGGCDLYAGVVHVQAAGDIYRVIHVLRTRAAQSSPQTTQRLKAMLFQEWLAEQRRAARIEWFWGEAKRTARQTESFPRPASTSV